MHLVTNWQGAWRWFSIQIALVGAAVQGAILAFPSLKDWLGDTATHVVGLLILVGLVGGRLIQQPAKGG